MRLDGCRRAGRPLTGESLTGSASGGSLAVRLASTVKENQGLSVDTSDFKNGMHIYLDGEVFTIVEFQHVKPGKGGAFVRTKLRKLKSGATLEKTFRAGSGSTRRISNERRCSSSIGRETTSS